MLRALIAAAVLVATPAAAHQYNKGALNIVHPSSRLAAKGMTGVGYLTVNNKGATPDFLLAIESPIAAKVEIHASTNTNGVSRMAKVKGGVAVPAKGSVKLEPGGLHVMFVKLKQPLAAGDRFSAVLVFRNAGRVPIEFMVQGGAGHVH